ncbi:hypothetical protein [Streptomyces sp. NPDC001933]|uniref:hypothetical protein n=1 Tax=Streptomyces sp. NPDC001933 TaxID=3364626 RepID=UPI0036A8CF99
MRTKAKAAIVAAAVLGSLAITAPAQASDNVDGCDLAYVPSGEVYGETDSRSYKGRDLTLYTGKIFDAYAYAAITDVARYDKVYVQRSMGDFNMHSKPRHPSDEYVRAVGGGVMTCRYIANWADANVADYAESGAVRLQTGEDNRSHAVRACVKPTRAKFKCTRWFIDHY